MSNFELIDDFLTNRLGDKERASFEQQLNSDPSLKADVELQKQIIDSVKNARAAELKAMLNNVPVSGGYTSGISAAKFAAVVGTAALVGIALYFYLKPEDLENKSEIGITKNEITTPVQQDAAPAAVIEKKEIEEQTPTKPEVEVKKQEIKKEAAKPNTTNQPRIEVADPSNEFVENSSTDIVKIPGNTSGVSNSHIEVEMDSSNKKYSFHYQFAQGKLLLYGAFDKGLYEILEINGDKKSVFLFYKENYYMLDEKQRKIISLEPIRDGLLLKKLRDYRNQ
jgi:hypothetical protein